MNNAGVIGIGANVEHVAIWVDGGRLDTAVRATDCSGLLEVRSWGKWGERHCRRGSCRRKATKGGKSKKCRLEFHGFPPWRIFLSEM